MELVQKLTNKERERRYEELKKVKYHLLEDKNAPFYDFRKSNNSFPVIGEGDHGAKIMFVGEAPGANEAKQGRPFCGASGNFLDEMLAHIGLDRQKVYITNIVKDRPPKNRDPKPEEIEYYSSLLDRMRKAGLEDKIDLISRIHGKIFKGKIKDNPVSIVTLYHPAAALYNGSKRPLLLKDIEILKQFL